MKASNISFSTLMALVVFFISFSCTKKVSENESGKIENTLKSVSFWLDSIPVDPKTLLESLEKVNIAIDSTGYPDAGYKLWVVNGADSLNSKIMIEGFWPDQKTYDIIHNHKSYIKATGAEKPIMERLKRVQYYRLSRVN